MDTWNAWIPVTNTKEFPSSRDIDKLEINISNNSLPFLTLGDGTSPSQAPGEPGGIINEEPVEVIIFRVIFALLISISLVINLLLILAILRIKCRIAVVYMLLAYLIVPDILFYIKLITELIHWDSTDPGWAASDWSCGLWQFASHLYPLTYSVTLTAILYHAFITLYMDYKGDYEKSCRKWLPLLLVALSFILSVICASSGFYSRAKTSASPERSDTRQYCDLAVPAIVGGNSAEIAEISRVTYRLVYEIVLPYMIPLVLVAFPYVSLLVGIIRSPESTEHSSYNTKMSVVVTLWVLTTYLMLQVPTLIRNVFSIFSVWHRLTSLFDATDDPRVPIFQTYIHVTAYVLTIVWAIVRPALTFRYSTKLRQSLCR